MGFSIINMHLLILLVCARPSGQ